MLMQAAAAQLVVMLELYLESVVLTATGLTVRRGGQQVDLNGSSLAQCKVMTGSVSLFATTPQPP